MRRLPGWAVPPALLLAAALAVVPGIVLPAPAVATDEPPTGPFEVVMVTWRGCEDACEGFWDHLDAAGVEVEATILDAAQDRTRLPDFVTQIQAAEPDLVVTWGTSVTLGTIGAIDYVGEPRLEGIPALFMIVADPVGAGVIEEYATSGRPLVTGTHNRIPEASQMRALADYLPFDRIGVIYNDDELNAVLKAEEVRRVGAEQGFEVVSRVLARDAEGNPLVEDIAVAVEEVAAQDVDLIYLGSSSFLLDNADVFTSTALEQGLPVATAYEGMVRDSHGLIALGSAYYNVGQLAGYQAEQILVDGRLPGDLEVVGLDRFSVLVNMETARQLGLYPPMLLLRYAEMVDAAN
jgi:putative ABC transport system substrate-binding protein